MSTFISLLLQVLVQVLLYHSTGILDTLVPRTLFSENQEGDQLITRDSDYLSEWFFFSHQITWVVVVEGPLNGPCC